jgi:hypothetical protein
MTNDDERARDEEDLAAAAVDLAYAERDDASLPAHLAAKIGADADRHFAALAGEGNRIRTRAQVKAQTTTGAAGSQVIVMPFPPAEGAAAAKGFDVARWGGWLAAAACFALLAGQSLRTERAGAAPAEARDAAPAPVDEVHLPVGGGDARGVSGEVAWSPGAQSGTLRLRGLSPNDPAVSRYELWIRDDARDARYPLPVALFDATPAGEAVVTIAPSLRGSHAVELVVTREAPAGAVVSAGAVVVLVAPITASADR